MSHAVHNSGTVRFLVSSLPWPRSSYCEASGGRKKAVAKLGWASMDSRALCTRFCLMDILDHYHAAFFCRWHMSAWKRRINREHRRWTWRLSFCVSFSCSWSAIFPGFCWMYMKYLCWGTWWRVEMVTIVSCFFDRDKLCYRSPRNNYSLHRFSVFNASLFCRH